MAIEAFDTTITQRWLNDHKLRYFRRKMGRQQKPFLAKMVLPYALYECADRGSTFIPRINGQSPLGSYDVRTYALSETCITATNHGGKSQTSPNPNMALAYNRAYNGFVRKVHESTADLGITVGEGRKTLSSVKNRFGLTSYQNAGVSLTRALVNLAAAASALKRGNFNGFADALGLSKRAKKRVLRQAKKRREALVAEGKNLPKTFGSLWLEYWLGWAPTASVIVDAVKVLESPFTAQSKPVRSRSSFIVAGRRSDGVTGDVGSTNWEQLFQAEIGGNVVVTNHNEALRSRLGLNNLAVVAWELVTLSFVVNWFYDIQTWLRSFSALSGFHVADSWSTFSSRVWWSGVYVRKAGTVYPGIWTRRGETYAMDRRSGFPHPTPVLTLSTLSLTRATTAISLLTQLFKTR